MKFCSGCTNLNEESSHFCDECGASVFVRAIVIGRSADVDFSIDDPSVSQQHVAAARINGEIVVRDLNSTNGTCINQRDHKIVGNVQINTTDTLVLGSYKLSVSELDRHLQAPANGGRNAAGSAPTPSKVGTAKTSYIVGRDPEADFTADVPTVSRRHIQIAKATNGWEVTDLGSSNGTFLNSKSNRLDKPALVTLNDVLLLGTYRLPVKLLTDTLEVSNTNTSKASINLQPKNQSPLDDPTSVMFCCPVRR